MSPTFRGLVWREFGVLSISRGVSVSRPPTWSSEREPDDLDDLEELGDDAIISQQTAAHAPQPRANVSEESRSVVITDHPRRRDTQPPKYAVPRSTGEATLVIRDRRALDELRANIVRRKRKKPLDRRSLYMWGALGLAAFVLGGVVAFLATDTRAEAPSADDQPSSGRSDARLALPRIAVPSPAPNSAVVPAHTSATPPAVRLDDLPLESPRRK